jgi:hypothetical protein
MNESKHHPEHHVNEEVRNDFMDTALAFGAFFGFLLLMGIVATAIKMMQG